MDRGSHVCFKNEYAHIGVHTAHFFYKGVHNQASLEKTAGTSLRQLSVAGAA